jgi:hypothetical protein
MTLELCASTVFDTGAKFIAESQDRELLTPSARSLYPSTCRRYPSFMASFSEIERLALALSEHERATLAANLIDSLSDVKAVGDDESGAVKFKKVNSSMLRRVRYDPQNRFLDVVFRTGESYRYKDVPPAEYKGLMNAESHGKYMQIHIIDHYDVIRLNP